MPIVNYPFVSLGPRCPARAMLPVKIHNPATGRFFQTWGLIDTGADECSLPAELAEILGHSLLAGNTKAIATGNGITNSYAHTTRIEILALNNNGGPTTNIVYTITDTPVDFMPNLQTVLLGVRNFLASFTLTINYPTQTFSVTGNL